VTRATHTHANYFHIFLNIDPLVIQIGKSLKIVSNTIFTTSGLLARLSRGYYLPFDPFLLASGW
jgi:hypothetical protein